MATKAQLIAMEAVYRAAVAAYTKAKHAGDKAEIERTKAAWLAAKEHWLAERIQPIDREPGVPEPLPLAIKKYLKFPWWHPPTKPRPFD